MFDIVSNPVYQLSPLAALLVSFILIIIVITRGYRSSGRWVFTGILLSLGIWGFLLFGMRSSPDIEDAVVWNRIASIPGTATFVLYYHFTVVYTKAKKQAWLVIASYLLLLGITIVSPTGLIIQDLRIESYGYAPVQGPLSIYVSLFTFPLLAGAFYNLVRGYRASQSFEVRNRLLYLLIAIIFPVIGALLDSSTNLPPMLVWGQVGFILVCSYSVFRYHLLDIRIIARRGIAYLLISTMVAVPYVVVVISLGRFIVFSMETIWYHALIILLLSIALHPLQQWAQQLVDRLFYRDRYDYLMSLERLSRETQSILDMDELCARFLNSLAGALRITRGCLFLKTDDNREYVVKKCIDSMENHGDIKFRKSSLFINYIETTHKAVTLKDFDIIPHLQNLTLEERANIERLGTGIYLPIFYQGKELTAILALGDKEGQNRYSAEDMQLISTIANQMAISLENARLFQSEKRIRETLEKTDAQKTEFLHTIAHELKTPLTAILSSSEILEDGFPDNEMVRKRLFGNISRSAHTMNRRVTELIEMAKTQIGTVKIITSPLEIKSTVVDSASQLMVLFENRHQKLQFNIPDGLPSVEADKDKIQQVLFNLLSNANKYSPEGSVISLVAQHLDGSVRFELHDTAPVIPDESKELIFTPYFRIENPERGSETPGLGLGLAISKKLVELHKGKIWVETNREGGNTFIFTLPVSEKNIN